MHPPERSGMRRRKELPQWEKFTATLPDDPCKNEVNRQSVFLHVQLRDVLAVISGPT
jgi:hypothetical protein